MKKISGLILSAITAAFLVGCGGGGGSSSGSTSDNTSTSTSTSNGINGTVAIGSGVSAQIEILDMSTCQVLNTSSDSTGAYSLANMNNLNGPFLLKASSSLGFTMYSFIDTSSNRVANITPLTHYAMDVASRESASNASIASTYASCNNGSFTGLSQVSALQSALNTAISVLTSNIRSAFSENTYASVNPFNNAFTANHSGYDGLLDSMDISLNNNDTFIRLGGHILQTTGQSITDESTQNITNTVKDSAGNVLDGVTVSIDLRNDNITFDALTTLTASGTYTLTIPKYREYVITYTKEGYTPVSQNYNSFENINPTNVVMFTTDEIASSTPVTPTLNITDSRNNTSISSGVTIKIRNGYNNRLGDVSTTITSDTASSLSLVPGTYTFEVSKDGYTTKYQTVTVTSSTISINLDLLSINTSSSVSATAFATIIVRWGANPEDVDSHLLFDNREVYYSNKSFGAIPADKTNPCATTGVVASLDLDDTSSYGPETTTICDGTKGPFEFNLYHFSGSSNMGESPTSVELVTRDGSRYEFAAPTTGFTGRGDTWKVFSIDSNQVVTRVNEITSNYVANTTFVTTASLSNKTYKIVDTTNGSYVVYSFNADGTGNETGYTSAGVMEYPENITWSIISTSLNSNLIKITAADGTYQYHKLYTTIANGAHVSLLNSSENVILNSVISNYSDNVSSSSSSSSNITGVTWYPWNTTNVNYRGSLITNINMLLSSFTDTEYSNYFGYGDGDAVATLAVNGTVVNVSGYETHGGALHGTTVLGSWTIVNGIIKITMDGGEVIYIRLTNDGGVYTVATGYIEPA